MAGQKDQTQLQADIDSLMVANTTGDVTVDLQRVLLQDITASVDGRSVNEITTAYTTTAADSNVICAGTFTVTLHPLATAQRPIMIKSTTGVITLEGDGVETIEGLTSRAMGSGESLSLVASSTGWLIV